MESPECSAFILLKPLLNASNFCNRFLFELNTNGNKVSSTCNRFPSHDTTSLRGSFHCSNARCRSTTILIHKNLPRARKSYCSCAVGGCHKCVPPQIVITGLTIIAVEIWHGKTRTRLTLKCEPGSNGCGFVTRVVGRILELVIV